MSGTCRVRLALGLVLAGAAAACRSLPGPPSLLDGGLVSSPLLPEREQAAQARALYSLGIHHELADEYDLAGQAYLRASELDPGNERILLRLASILVLQRRTEDACCTVGGCRPLPLLEKALGWLAAFYYSSTGDGARPPALPPDDPPVPRHPLGWLLQPPPPPASPRQPRRRHPHPRIRPRQGRPPPPCARNSSASTWPEMPKPPMNPPAAWPAGTPSPPPPRSRRGTPRRHGYPLRPRRSARPR